MIFCKKLISFFGTLCFLTAGIYAQDKIEDIRQVRTGFYAALSGNAVPEILLDDSLSYGHSNGWIETKAELLSNLGKKLTYHSITEDSVRISVNGDMAHVRFVGNFDVSLAGKRNTYRLRVLEVWVKRGKQWKIFARQAIKG